LGDLQTMMENTGTIRSRLAPNFKIAAFDIWEQRRLFR
jgi:hypothetical protein